MEELRSFIAVNPNQGALDLKLAIKGGGDNFQITDHQGKTINVEQFSIFLIRPGGKNNACGGRGGGARTLAIIRASETSEVVRTIVRAVEDQIIAAGLRESVTVDGQVIKLDWLLTPDYKFAAECFGHQGQNSMFFCLHCLATKEGLLAQETIQPFQERDFELMRKIGQIMDRHFHTVTSVRAGKTSHSTQLKDINAVNTDMDLKNLMVEQKFIVDSGVRITQAQLNAFRQGISRSVVVRIFTKYRLDPLHLKINIVNSLYDYIVALAAQIGREEQLADIVREAVKLLRPITKWEGNQCSYLLFNRIAWINVLYEHPYFPVIERALDLITYMLTVISLPLPSLSNTIIEAFKVAAQNWHSLINLVLSKDYTPTSEEGAVPEAKPARYGWKVWHLSDPKSLI